MDSSCLPYKYKSLKFVEEYSEKSIIALGWKARKYIKWTDVHVGNDRQLLKEFGRLAVEEKLIDDDIYPRLNQILLNVQYWRLDSENWSIEPEHEKAWDQARDLILACNKNPKIILSYIADYLGMLDDIPDSKLYPTFENLVLLGLILKVRKISNIKFNSDEISSDFETLVTILNESGHFLGEFQGVNRHQVFSMLDLPEIEKAAELTKQGFQQDIEQHVVVVEGKLSESRFIKIDSQKGVVTVTVNSNNECIKFMNTNNEIREFFMKFIISYAKTITDNPAMASDMDSFNAYLALNLNRQFKASR